MKLPLSVDDQKAISDDYLKVVKAAEELSASINVLLETLNKKMAYLDKETKKSLDRPMEKTMSAMFQMGVQRYKIEKANLSGRGFTLDNITGQSDTDY